VENEPVATETASLSGQHPLPPAKPGRGGMGARFGPDAGISPVLEGFGAWLPTALAAVGEGAESVAHLSLVQPCSAVFHPKSSTGVRPSPPLAQPAWAPPANLIIKATHSTGRRGSCCTDFSLP